MPAIRLTERRKQFLQSLIDLYHRTQLPVHYEALADSVGVSKWTAYDMLKQLEKQGLITRGYAVRAGEAGRSQIVFVPTEQAEAICRPPQVAEPRSADLAAIKEKVVQFVRELRDLSPAKAIQKAMSEVPKIEAGVLFCACLIGLLLTYLQTLGDGTVGLVKSMLQHAPGQETRLAMFVGMMVGTVAPTAGNGYGEQLTELAGRYLKTLGSLTEEEREMLADFLEEGLAANPVGG